MKIGFKLFWSSKGSNWQKAFKSQEASSLFSEYLSRISHFISCNAETITDLNQYEEYNQKATLWLCERNPKRSVGSEEIARCLEHAATSSVSELHIAIGGPDGLTQSDFRRIHPKFIWSFGSLTLPHELAAVVAAEQIYRAWTILRKHPYHAGH